MEFMLLGYREFWPPLCRWWLLELLPALSLASSGVSSLALMWPLQHTELCIWVTYVSIPFPSDPPSRKKKKKKEKQRTEVA